MAKTKRMFMGGAAKAAMQSVKSAPKTGPAKPGMPPPQSMPPQSMPPRGMPPRGMPPRGDTGTNIQKIDYAAQNAAGPGKIGNYGPPPNLPPQVPTQTQSNMPPPPPQGMPSQGIAGIQAKFGPPSAAPGAPKTMGGMGMKNGGKVSSASSRGDGIATKGKTKGRFV